MKSQLYIKEVKGKGRGVFSKVEIMADEVIEVCPLLIFNKEGNELIYATFIMNYCFYYNRDENLIGLATGFGSIYNHKAPSNARHQINREEKEVHIIAVNTIAANEEICINYNGESGDESINWFLNRGLEYQP